MGGFRLGMGTANWRRSTSPTPVWESVGTLSDVAFGTPRLGATFTKIDYELPINRSGTAVVSRVYVDVREQNKQATAFQVRDAMIQKPTVAADITQYGAQEAAYGIVPYMTPNKTYQVLAHVMDDNGLWIRVYLGTVTTKADNIAAASALVATKFVATGGVDTGNSTGGTQGAPWKTVQQAVAFMSASAICEVGPGYYGPATTARASAGTFKAQNPASDDDKLEINVGQQSIIEPTTVTAPTGTPAHSAAISSNPYAVAPWVEATVTGPGETTTGGTFASPTTGASYGGDGTLWKLASVPNIDTAGFAQVGYGATRQEDPSKIPFTRKDTATCDTVSGWAEILYTNRWYNDSGSWLDGSGNLYVKLPSHARRADGQLSRNPNDYWMKLGGDNVSGIEINADSVRVSGFKIHCFQYDVQVRHPRANCVIDHNVLSMAAFAVRLGQGSADAGATPAQNIALYNHDNVVQYNRCVEKNFWRADGTGIPWWMCKSVPVLQNGLTYNSASGYTGALTRWTQMENTALGSRGGGVRNTYRYNLVDGWFNGATAMGVTGGEGRYSTYGVEFHNNQYDHLVDDAWEFDQAACNLAVWQESVRNALVGLSLGPTDFGPVYAFECDLVLGRMGIAKRLTDADNSSLGAVLVKHSGASSPRMWAYLSNLTFYATETTVFGASENASPTGNLEEGISILNSIFCITGTLVRASATQVGWYEEDYNVMASNNLEGSTNFGWRWNGIEYGNNHAAYKAASGQGTHSQIVDGVSISGADYAGLKAHFRDPDNVIRDLRLKTASYDKFVGRHIPGFTRLVTGRSVRIGYEP